MRTGDGDSPGQPIGMWNPLATEGGAEMRKHVAALRPSLDKAKTR
jgi:hypothetical protein